MSAQTQLTPAPASSLQERTTRIEQALRTQDLSRAMEEYRAMVAADPNNAQAWTGMGVLLYGSGRASEAADALRHALQLDPTARRAELFLALSQADMGACQEALPTLQRRFESEPTGKLQWLTGITLLECLTGGKDARTALPVVDRLKETYPGDSDVLYEAAKLYTRMWNETANELLTAHPDRIACINSPQRSTRRKGTLDKRFGNTKPRSLAIRSCHRCTSVLASFC